MIIAHYTQRKREKERGGRVWKKSGRGRERQELANPGARENTVRPGGEREI